MSAIRATDSLNVRLWHLADIDAHDEHVCFWDKADIPKSTL